MKARIFDFSVGFDGRQRLTLELDGDFREQYDTLKENPVSVELKKWRKHRSLDANAYAWVLIGKLSEAINVPKADIYREAIRNIGGVSQVVCVQNIAVDKLCEAWNSNGIGWQTETFPSKLEDCTNVTLYYGSSTYDSKQMSQLVDYIVDECKAQGIETISPDELARLTESWK